MGLLDLIMLYKISEMEDKIDQLQSQLHPSETPETKEDIEAWLAGHDNEEESVDLEHTAAPETAEDIEEWLNERDKEAVE